MQVLALLLSLTSLAAIAVALRLWTRLRLRSAGWDDLLIVVALAANLVLFSCRVVGKKSHPLHPLPFKQQQLTQTPPEIHHGLTKPSENLTTHTLESQLRALYLSLPFYHLTLITSKLSALALYTRLFRLRRVLLTSYLLAAFLVLAGLWMVLSGFLFCWPVRAFWTVVPDSTSTSPGAHCLPKGPVWLLNGAMQISTHVVVLAIPLVVIPRLTLRRRQKGGLLLLFGVGSIVVAISIVQLVTVIGILEGGKGVTEKSIRSALLASTEASASIICACMPPLYALFSRVCSRCVYMAEWMARAGRRRQQHQQQLTPTQVGGIQARSIHLTRPVIEEPAFLRGVGLGFGVYTASVEVSVQWPGERRGEQDEISVVRTVDVDVDIERGSKDWDLDPGRWGEKMG
ncbi:uncharacterized protein BP01DRAFT_390791 [Aspergillus saccharolyticus JOP 1030-1]|uniref:Rhodopsin domain-containing protein n=1 Tax=Aspergillus saccharolyticus JOP 1030-1 TaxID=1450539 RepID=A0A318ZHW6_9EURO|nr:hypothetical protein BP01DRAFT_390791 [Aspergillus saccharolyticus JOP 1030-1]PYH46525.1 hypothetical protein BP01DRAFT_390791 [Aspergillus saccharolyticus JOP 1030-1]